MAPPDRPPPPLDPRRPRPPPPLPLDPDVDPASPPGGGARLNPISRGTVLSARFSDHTPPSGEGACACDRTGRTTQIAAAATAHTKMAVRCMTCRSTVARTRVGKPEPGTREPEPENQNPRTPNAEPRTPNPERRTRSTATKSCC